MRWAVSSAPASSPGLAAAAHTGAPTAARPALPKKKHWVKVHLRNGDRLETHPACVTNADGQSFSAQALITDGQDGKGLGEDVLYAEETHGLHLGNMSEDPTKGDWAPYSSQELKYLLIELVEAMKEHATHVKRAVQSLVIQTFCGELQIEVTIVKNGREVTPRVARVEINGEKTDANWSGFKKLYELIDRVSRPPEGDADAPAAAAYGGASSAALPHSGGRNSGSGKRRMDPPPAPPRDASTSSKKRKKTTGAPAPAPAAPARGARARGARARGARERGARERGVRSRGARARGARSAAPAPRRPRTRRPLLRQRTRRSLPRPRTRRPLPRPR